MSRSAFDTLGTFEAFREQGHNPRTRNAWEHGIEAAVLGRALIYSNSTSDYRNAERAGFKEARRRIAAGHSWRCACCGTIRQALFTRIPASPHGDGGDKGGE